jgi:predicted RNase H-like HicB family nuclease
MNIRREPLEYYLKLEYPFNALADPDGGYVVVFHDLPGCMTQVENLTELPEMAEDARTGWIETEYEQGHDIPLPSQPEEYSGKFNVRLPRSLHRVLAEEADRQRVSLNQYVVMLLSRGDAQAQVERQLTEISYRLDHVSDPLTPNFLKLHLAGAHAPAGYSVTGLYVGRPKDSSRVGEARKGRMAAPAGKHPVAV